MENLTILYTLSFVISTVVLIVFFFMAVNISKMATNISDIKSLLMAEGIEKRIVTKWFCKECRKYFTVFDEQYIKEGVKRPNCTICKSSDTEEVK